MRIISIMKTAQENFNPLEAIERMESTARELAQWHRITKTNAKPGAIEDTRITERVRTCANYLLEKFGR